MNDIYFDSAATTMPYPEILKEFLDISAKYYANPSALHSKGLEAERVIKKSAETISKKLGVSKEEIYFTSGGTESNNLAITGLARARFRTHKHIITQLSEHPSVIQVYKLLEREGFDITWLKPNKSGTVTPEDVVSSLRADTGLVSIMQVNNETGAICDINSIGKAIKSNSSAYFFSDGVQGFGKIRTSLKYVDCYSFSGHKLGSVKGVGGLFLKSNIRIIPYILGGGQQKNIRSGTENTAGTAALAKASEVAFDSLDENYLKAAEVKAKLSEITALLDNAVINSSDNSSPYIVNISFKGVKSEVLLHSLAEEGIFVSAGSACSSNKKDKNILHTMGYDKEIYESAIRFSFSPQNTVEEAQHAVGIICEKVKFLSKYVKH